MTAHTTANSDVYSGDLQSENFDEIDLRRYVLVLFKWWREILAISILTGLITGVTLTWLNSQKPLVYSANADILIARLLSTIELDSRVSTSSESNHTDQNGWRTSLLQLSKSSVVANAVYAELKDELPTSLRSPEALISVIYASIPLSPDERFSSNLLRISATTTEAELSATIANSWAHHLIGFINGVFGEVPQVTLDGVTVERDDAFRIYQASETAYDRFVADNQIDTLTRQIQEKTTLRETIMANYGNLLTSMVSTEFNAKLSLYASLTNMPINHAVAMINAQSEGTVRSLGSLYDQHSSAIVQLGQARAMEASLLAGGEAAAKSNVAALQLLKLGAFAAMRGSGDIPIVMPTSAYQDLDMTLDEQLTDVYALITGLERYVAQLEDDITQLAESRMMGADLDAVGGNINDPNASPEAVQMTPAERVAEAYAELLNSDGILNQAPVDVDLTISDAHEGVLAELESEIRSLQAAVSAENAKQRELTHQRDLAWTTYDTVGNKLEELKLLRSSANTEVRMGNPAMVPLSAEPRTSLVVPVVGLTLLAFFLAVVLAFLVEGLGGSPFFSRRTA